jgi:hypothetical protein
MFELIYRSIANDKINSDDILNILNTSREFNLKHNITGCLLFHKNEFVQILEGEKQDVEKLYAKVEKDGRHTNVALIAKNEKDERAFHNWAMAYHEITEENYSEISKILFIDNFLTLSEIAERPTHAVKLFWFISKLILKNNH